MMEYPEELKNKERYALQERREKLNKQEKPPVGVALSGGGVRSATQSLGAFQALQEKDLDSEIDYLSTVSGGGYFGSFWGRCWMENDTDLNMDDRKIKYLRNSGNYIAPTGSGDLFRSVAHYLTNWLAMYAVMFSFFLMATLLFRFMPVVPQVFELQDYSLSVYAFVPLVGLVSLLCCSVFRIFSSKNIAKYMTLSSYIVFVGLGIFVMDSIGYNIYQAFTIEEVGGIAATSTFILYLFSVGKDLFLQVPKTIPLLTSIIKYSILIIVVTIILGSIFAIGHYYFWEIAGFTNNTVEYSLTSPNATIYAFGLLLSLIVINYVFGIIKNLLNRLSMHGLFHNRLVRGFLGASVPNRLAKGVMYSTSFEEDDVEEYKYKPYENGGPLHIINMTLNETIDGRSDLYQLNRKGSNFAVVPTIGKSVAARHHCLTQASDLATVHTPIDIPNKSYQVWGYKATKSEKMTIGNYMAISAAAMSTGTGKLTTMFSSLMSGLLGVRFGYWWNSGVKKEKTIFSKFDWLFTNQRLLLDEFLARFKGTSKKHWYLSDGGHFENLALYELLRRKLKFMVSFDFGQDLNYQFESLADLSRTVRTDFGIELRMLTSEELDDKVSPKIRHLFGVKSDLRREAGAFDGIELSDSTVIQGTGDWAKAYATIVEAKYNDGTIGHILYIVPTLVGNEPVDVISYYMRNPDFPQQTTNDQFFNEEQWESYRKLMNHIVTELFSDNDDNARTPNAWLRNGEL